MKLSIIIPAYNESRTILETITRCQNVSLSSLVAVWEREIIIVDDGSTDATKYLLQSLPPSIKIITHDKNYGKGKAIQTGIAYATGDWSIIQDADLEYNPNQFEKLLEKISTNTQNFKPVEMYVVYGARAYTKGYIIYRIGAFVLTSFLNILYQSNIRDSYTCYKLIPTSLFQSLHLTSLGFEIEAEITAKLLRQRIYIFEVPIEYYPRKFLDGKKIRGRDAWKGLWTIWCEWYKNLC